MWEGVHSPKLGDCWGEANRTRQLYSDERGFFFGHEPASEPPAVCLTLLEHMADYLQKNFWFSKSVVRLEKNVPSIRPIQVHRSFPPCDMLTAARDATVRGMMVISGFRKYLSPINPIEKAVWMMGTADVGHDGAEGAFDELIRSKSGHSTFGGGANGRIVNFRQEALKLLSSGAGLHDRCDHIPEPLVHMVRTCVGILRGFDGEVAMVRQKMVATDSALCQSGRLHGRLLHRLHSHWVIELGSCIKRTKGGRCRESSDDSMQRMISDLRTGNEQSPVPIRSALANPAALNDIDSVTEQQCCIHAGDVDVCFYQYGIIDWSRSLFIVSPIEYRHRADEDKAYFSVSTDRECCLFLLRVLPMIWSWTGKAFSTPGSVMHLWSAHSYRLVTVPATRSVPGSS